MNKLISMAVGASLALWFGLGADSVRAQSADLSEIGTDPRRALIVDVMILADGTAEFVESYVTDVPPGSSIGNPQQIMLESLDATSIVIGTEYSWDPRWVFLAAAQPDDDGIFGEQLEVQSEALGSFSVLFNKDIDSVRISDVEAISELITVDVRFVVERFCSDEMNANPVDFNPECQDIVFSDSDLDGLLDVSDNCTEVANADQTDSDADLYGNACDADFNNDLVVNGLDVGTFVEQFGTVGPDADFNNDLVVNGLDTGPFIDMFGNAPGPSGLVQ